MTPEMQAVLDAARKVLRMTYIHHEDCPMAQVDGDNDCCGEFDDGDVECGSGCHACDCYIRDHDALRAALDAEAKARAAVLSEADRETARAAAAGFRAIAVRERSAAVKFRELGAEAPAVRCDLWGVIHDAAASGVEAFAALNAEARAAVPPLRWSRAGGCLYWASYGAKLLLVRRLWRAFEFEAWIGLNDFVRGVHATLDEAKEAAESAAGVRS
jgi:hypothetical protein